ncbi:MAG: MBL fold metallo-hydrolase [Alphaproteobacteria bacterium]|nr:MBL fold metallo-hydrolase [Alphaproteobacteria bacterium]
MSLAHIGAFALDRVVETDGLGFSPKGLIADLDEAVFESHFGWMVPGHYDPATRRFVMGVHSWVLRTSRHTILVDTCAGNHKTRTQMPGFHKLDTPWLARLAEVGVRPEAVDFVLCTHLHVDHVGWNTRLADGRWVPTFPNARYLFSRVEHDHWAKGRDEVYVDSVLPVVEKGQARMIEGSDEIEAGLRIEPAPGHTPGSVILAAESQGSRAIFSGDIMHHPVQVFEPDWNSRFCVDQAQARATRRLVLERCSDSGALLLPAHFGPPHGGRIRRRGDKFAIDFGLGG